jgi:hypothetical protein
MAGNERGLALAFAQASREVLANQRVLFEIAMQYVPTLSDAIDRRFEAQRHALFREADHLRAALLAIDNPNAVRGEPEVAESLPGLSEPIQYHHEQSPRRRRRSVAPLAVRQAGTPDLLGGGGANFGACLVGEFGKIITE